MTSPLRHAVGAALVLAMLMTPVVSLAVEPNEMLQDPTLEARAETLSKELRCVVCQNQSIDASSAPLARDMRLLVRERIAAGDTDVQAKAYLVERYGNFVLLKPPFQADTLLLWFGPLLILVVAGVALLMAARTGAPDDTDDLAPDMEDL
ncbi:MAG: cytochrome c-type biogenesis protein CcmH [Caulobacter sp.]|nr:cytochrome c-type biogenesis protein CcmH [Caulobacter sp.]